MIIEQEFLGHDNVDAAVAETRKRLTSFNMFHTQLIGDVKSLKVASELSSFQIFSAGSFYRPPNF
jgi:hypothetical protein